MEDGLSRMSSIDSQLGLSWFLILVDLEDVIQILSNNPEKIPEILDAKCVIAGLISPQLLGQMPSNLDILFFNMYCRQC